ncbi:MAG: DUF1553 domain-containing protein [Phycisphaera sp.]|nr:DUF1553 domain-containing protein [Phycisphaera sp.]
MTRSLSVAAGLSGILALTMGSGMAASTTRPIIAPAKVAPPAPRPDHDTIDFVRDVRPILSSKCFACHGPDAASRQAGLSLVDFDDATAEIEPGFAAIVPGNLDASEAWHRINDSLDPMPPTEAHDPLSTEEIEVLRRWIETGASYRPHWAYVTPTKGAIRIGDRDPVDDLLDARHGQLGLPASPRTDPTTLLRRLSLDLAGIPPTPEAVDAFVAEPSADRVAASVDRLLAAPEFGERLAVLWLDLVRYADTVGYHGDQEHRIWPYRDWVIHAFNDGMPFDRFTRLQLAGDLVAEEETDLSSGKRQDALVASGYNRLLQTSHEGGLQLAEYRAIYMADRVRNASEVWMGGTLGCAQCHDHKYDPYTHVDFHAFGAFFADIDDEEHIRNPYNGYNTTPTRREPEMRIVTPSATLELARLDRAAMATSASLARMEERHSQDDPEWEQDLRKAIAAGDHRCDLWVDDVLSTGGTQQGDWAFSVEPGLPARSGDKYRIQSSKGLVQHYTVETDRRIPVESGSSLEAWVNLDPSNPPKAVMLQVHTAGSWEHRAVWGDDSIEYGRGPGDRPSYRRLGDLPPTGSWHRLEVPLERIGLEAGSAIDGIAFTQFGGTVRWDATTVSHPGPAPRAVLAAIDLPAAEWTPEARQAVSSFRMRSDPVASELISTLDRIEVERRDLEASLPSTLFTRRLAEPRPVRILPRGDWLDESGMEVLPAVPSFLGVVPGRDGNRDRLDRLDLAEWLVSSEKSGGIGELTARVFVNRIWAMLFGEGLCPSEDDFGGQGRPPTHLQALDLLALDFMESGWDIKALVRRMVMTDAYARSSVPTVDAAALDPENLQFARQSRRRLPAEFVRDAALHAGGLLELRRGGPSVKPPQPKGHYRHLNFPMRRYEADAGPNQWRRGVYVHWQRQFLHPMMKAFDAPSREACTASRPISNTPLAALVLLNDPVFVQAARGLASQAIEAGTTDHERLVAAWRIALARHPKPAELDVLQRLLGQAREEFTSNPDRAISLLGVDTREGHWVPPAGIPATETAAWTQTCRAILNLHEAYTRD